MPNTKVTKTQDNRTVLIELENSGWKFFSNHGLLSLLTTEINWKTVNGGSSQYVDKIIQKLGKNVFVNTPISTVLRKKNKWEVFFGNGKGKMLFDKVILSFLVL